MILPFLIVPASPPASVAFAVFSIIIIITYVFSNGLFFLGTRWEHLATITPATMQLAVFHNEDIDIIDRPLARVLVAGRVMFVGCWGGCSCKWRRWSGVGGLVGFT